MNMRRRRLRTAKKNVFFSEVRNQNEAKSGKAARRQGGTQNDRLHALSALGAFEAKPLTIHYRTEVDVWTQAHATDVRIGSMQLFVEKDGVTQTPATYFSGHTQRPLASP
jgi:hypothetical protein